MCNTQNVEILFFNIKRNRIQLSVLFLVNFSHLANFFKIQSNSIKDICQKKNATNTKFHVIPLASVDGYITNLEKKTPRSNIPTSSMSQIQKISQHIYFKIIVK
jgi:hypothetical protein